MDRLKERPKIKLIFPCTFELYEPYSKRTNIHLPYGMGVLTSYLKMQNIYVEQDDLSAKLNFQTSLLYRIRRSELHITRFSKDIALFLETKELSSRLEKMLCKIVDLTTIKGFDIIGFSIFTYWHFLFALLLSHKIKELTDAPIVFGGPFITLFGQLYPGAFKFIDFMIAGEGGAPLARLAQCLIQKTPQKHIPGIIYGDKGISVMVPREEYPIEKMPLPDFEGLPMDLYKERGPYKSLCLPYQISRGCNGACSFCNTSNVNPCLEYKSYHKVVTELQQLKEKYGSDTFRFCDDAINTLNGYLEGLCETIVEHKIKIRWSSYAKIKLLNKALLEKMRLAGCWKLYFGIESGSDRILRSMNKEITTEQIEAVLRDSAEAGIVSFPIFMPGYPHERNEDIIHTVDFIRRNKRYLWLAQVNVLVVSFGSNLWSHPERYGITNLVPQAHNNHIFAFDEVGGLFWQEKMIQQARSKRQIIKTIRKYQFLRIVFEILFRS